MLVCGVQITKEATKPSARNAKDTRDISRKFPGIMQKLLEMMDGVALERVKWPADCIHTKNSINRRLI